MVVEQAVDTETKVARQALSLAQKSDACCLHSHRLLHNKDPKDHRDSKDSKARKSNPSAGNSGNGKGGQSSQALSRPKRDFRPNKDGQQG